MTWDNRLLLRHPASFDAVFHRGGRNFVLDRVTLILGTKGRFILAFYGDEVRECAPSHALGRIGHGTAGASVHGAGGFAVIGDDILLSLFHSCVDGTVRNSFQADFRRRDAVGVLVLQPAVGRDGLSGVELQFVGSRKSQSSADLILYDFSQNIGHGIRDDGIGVLVSYGELVRRGSRDAAAAGSICLVETVPVDIAGYAGNAAGAGILPDLRLTLKGVGPVKVRHPEIVALVDQCLGVHVISGEIVICVESRGITQLIEQSHSVADNVGALRIAAGVLKNERIFVVDENRKIKHDPILAKPLHLCGVMEEKDFF